MHTNYYHFLANCNKLPISVTNLLGIWNEAKHKMILTGIFILEKIAIISIIITATLVTMYNNYSRSSLAAFWTVDLRPSNILTMISWGRNFAHIWFYLPTVQVWLGKIFAFRAYNFIKSSNSLTGMFIFDHVANTDIFMWFHGKIDQKN